MDFLLCYLQPFQSWTIKIRQRDQTVVTIRFREPRPSEVNSVANIKISSRKMIMRDNRKQFDVGFYLCWGK